MSTRLAISPHFTAATFCCAVPVAIAAAQPEPERAYNLPRGDAATMLPLFADVSGRPVVFMMDKVHGEQTNAVIGNLTPDTAIELMLAGTPLVALQDKTTRGFTVTRRLVPTSREEVEHKPNAQPPANTMTRHKPSRVIHTLLAIVLPVFAYGQDSSSDATKKKDDELLVLSPFTVSVAKDNGYRATNSTTGTRLDSKIKDMPLSIEVITGDFIRDTGAQNLREALRYSPGIVLDSQFDNPLSATLTNIDTPNSAQANDAHGATRNSNKSTVKIRGFITDRVLRDGLLRQAATDTVDVERIEVLRGPSALLYGVGNFGGIVNYIPKVPTDKPLYNTELTFGSNSLYRAQFDVSPGRIYSIPGVIDASVRVTAALQDNGDFTDDFKHHHWFIAPVAQLKLWQNTTLKLDTEFGGSKDSGIGFQSVRSEVFAHDWPYSTNQRRYDFYTPPGTDQRTFRWSGGDTYEKNNIANVVLDLTQKFTDKLWLHATGGYTKNKDDSRNIYYGNLSTLDPIDANDNIVNGPTIALARYYKTPTTAAQTQYLSDLTNAAIQGGPALVNLWKSRPANFWYGDVYGTTVTPTSRIADGTVYPPSKYTVLNYQWSQYTQNEDRWQGRVDFNYKFDFYGHHDIIVGLQYDFDHMQSTNFGQSPDLSNNGVAPTNSDPFAWNYANPSQAKTLQWAVQGDGTTPSVALQPIKWQVDKTWNLGYFAIYQGRFFNDRLTIVGGAREDRVDYIGESRPTWQGPGKDTMAVVSQPKPATKASPQLGASVAITKNISIFGVYSTGLLPNKIGTLDGTGSAFGPVTAKNKELGLKFDVLNGKISGSVSYFKIERENVARSIWWAPAPGISAAAGGRIANYDPSKPTTIGFYNWGGLSPYTAWYASRADLSATAPWTKIYPTMGNILAKIPEDPVRKWGGRALPLGAVDINSTPSSQAVDASGHSLGMTLAQLWTQTVGAANLPTMPTNAPGTPAAMALNTGAPDVWSAAWVKTYGLMVSDKTKGETAAQELYDIFWKMNTTSTLASLKDPSAKVFNWGGDALPWLWAGDGAKESYYPGYWSDPNAQDDGSHDATMNSSIGQNNASVAFSDESKGFEVQFNIQATENLQIVTGWAHVVTKNTTSTLPYAAINDPTGNAAYGVWSAMGGSSGFGTVYTPREQAFSDPSNPGTYQVPPFDYGLNLDDTPKDTITLWSKYRFARDSALKGFGFGVGGQWQSQRLYDASVSVDGSISGRVDPDTGRIIPDQLYTKAQTTVNMVLDYQTELFRDHHPVRVALNIDNLLNDKKKYGYIYAPGLSWRLSTSFGF